MVRTKDMFMRQFNSAQSEFAYPGHISSNPVYESEVLQDSMDHAYTTYMKGDVPDFMGVSAASSAAKRTPLMRDNQLWIDESSTYDYLWMDRCKTQPCHLACNRVHPVGMCDTHPEKHNPVIGCAPGFGRAMASHPGSQAKTGTARLGGHQPSDLDFDLGACYHLQPAPPTMRVLSNDSVAEGISIINSQGDLFLPPSSMKGGILPDNNAMATMVGRELVSTLGLRTFTMHTAFQQADGTVVAYTEAVRLTLVLAAGAAHSVSIDVDAIVTDGDYGILLGNDVMDALHSCVRHGRFWYSLDACRPQRRVSLPMREIRLGPEELVSYAAMPVTIGCATGRTSNIANNVVVDAVASEPAVLYSFATLPVEEERDVGNTGGTELSAKDPQDPKPYSGAGSTSCHTTTHGGGGSSASASSTHETAESHPLTQRPSIPGKQCATKGTTVTSPSARTHRVRKRNAGMGDTRVHSKVQVSKAFVFGVVRPSLSEASRIVWPVVTSIALMLLVFTVAWALFAPFGALLSLVVHPPTSHATMCTSMACSPVVGLSLSLGGMHACDALKAESQTIPVHASINVAAIFAFLVTTQYVGTLFEKNINHFLHPTSLSIGFLFPSFLAWSAGFYKLLAWRS